MTRRRVSILAAAAAGASLAALLWLDRNPITSRALPDEAERPGEMPHGAAKDGADVWLAVDSRAIAESAGARSFAKLDLSMGWLAPIQGEFGPVAIADLAKPGSVTPGAKAPRALIVTS